MKRLLILGAGRGQIGLYKAAKEIGYYIIAGTMKGDNLPCLIYADEVSYMDISFPNEVLEKASRLNIDGVATSCLDTGIIALGKTCDALGLIGLKEDSAIMCNNKARMKKAFTKEGVNTAKYFEISSIVELNKALNRLEFPVIIKATDLQGSRGIYIAKTIDKVYEGFNYVMSMTNKKYCIIEEFIEGLEFGAQAFINNGQVLFVMLHGDNTYMSHTAVPIGHYVPFECNSDIKQQTIEIVEKAIKAIGLDNCAVNVDLILKNDKVYIIEITGRVGANCLPELVEINYGIEYYKMIASLAVGDNPLLYWNNRQNVEMAGLAQMLISKDKGGIIKNISYDNNVNDPDILEVSFFKSKGDKINKFLDSNDCIGQMIVKGRNMQYCEKKEKEVLSKIVLNLE